MRRLTLRTCQAFHAQYTQAQPWSSLLPSLPPCDGQHSYTPTKARGSIPLAMKGATKGPHVKRTKPVESVRTVPCHGESPTFKSAMLETAGDIGIKFPKCVRNCYADDEFFVRIIGQPNVYSDFTLADRLIFKRANGAFILCIPDIKTGEWSMHEIVIHHTHSLLAHLGHRKTLALLRMGVWC